MQNILFFTSNTNQNYINIDSKVFEPSKENLINLSKENNNDFLFASDDINFLQIAFRLYNQTFDNFVYISNEENSSKSFGELDIFLTAPINENENITKPIYVFGELPKTNLDITFKHITSFEEIKKEVICEKEIQKVFHFENRFLITEIIDFNYKIITLDNSSPKGNIGLNSFFFNLENHLIENMEYIFRIFDDLSKDITPIINQIKTVLEKLSQNEQEKFIIHFKFLVNNLSDENIKNYLFSFLANLRFFTPKMFDSLIEEVINNDKLNLQNKNFLFWQYSRINFVMSLEKQASQEVFWKFYRDIYSNYKKLFESIEFIPKEKRNENLIFIFINQFLTELHAPTRLLLERAYHLTKDFNKEILIINTADILPKVGAMNFYNTTIGNKIAQYSNINQIPYKDINIPFYQSAVDMPNENEMLNILSIVNEYKPYFILNIGSANLTADLASNLVTSVSFPTTSNLAISECQIRINRSEIKEKEDLSLLDKLNINSDSIIVSHPYGEVISKITYTKKDFNLPEDKFLLSVVGNRLGDEVTDEFLSMLLETIKYNTHIVFIGSFATYDKYCSKYPKLEENSTLLGFQEHLYDVMKLFDLFVNPARIGGGTGGLYSIANSVPLVTLDYGDVHFTSEGFFSVTSYKEMGKRIINNITNKDYYNEQSLLAEKVLKNQVGIKDEVEKLLHNIYKSYYLK